MFWYAIALCDDPQDADDYRFTDDRELVKLCIRMFQMKVRCVAKPV